MLSNQKAGWQLNMGNVQESDVLQVKQMKAWVGALALLTLCSMGAVASTGGPSADNKPAALSAHQTVEQTTVQLLELIESAKSYVDEDPDRYYNELGELLSDFVDFDAFSRAVMGKYASSKRLASLEDQAAEKLRGQIERFSSTFKQALINTYGKGLLVFEGERIEVVPPSPDARPSKPGRATVKQLIYGDRATPYEIFYSLKQNQSGEWRIRNMVLESTNLGKVYRNQFDNAYKVYEGDIDRIIENWVSG